MRWTNFVITALLLCVLFTAAKCVIACFLPVTLDEAYYWVWSRYLDLGYFDHPPAVALLGLLDGFVEPRNLSLRLLSILVYAVGACCFLFFLARQHLGAGKAALISFLLLNAHVLGMAWGVINGPDVFMILFWIVALGAALRALHGSRFWWVLAGAATGFGFLSKYTMILILPVFLYGLWREDRRGLKSAWPYAGALTALLIVLPHLVWLQKNDWITLRFQMRHGFSSERAEQKQHLNFSKKGFARQEIALPGTIEHDLGSYFYDPALQEPPRKERSKIAQMWRQFSQYWSAQLGLWGVLLLAFLPAFRAWWRKRWTDLVFRKSSLLSAATWFPLCFFGLSSLFAKVEPNWPCVYVIGAVLLAAPLLSMQFKYTLTLCVVNFSLLALPLLRANDMLPGRIARFLPPDRLARETLGYADLEVRLRQEKKVPLFADSYQLISMLAYGRGEVFVTQFPGVGRPSAFSANLFLPQNVQSQFMLISRNQIPPMIPGFLATDIEEFGYCAESGAYKRYLFEANIYENPCPRRLVLRVFLTHYEPSSRALVLEMLGRIDQHAHLKEGVNP